MDRECSTLFLVFGLPPAFVAASLGDLGVVEVAGLEAKVGTNPSLSFMFLPISHI